MRDAIHAFDNKMTAWIQGWPGWLQQPMLAITNVGQPTTVILFTIGLIIWAIWKDVEHLGVAGWIVLGTIIFSTIVKFVMRRARPINDYVKKMIFHTYSFPSGHATAATAGFGFLAYLVSVTLPQPWGGLLAAILVIFSLLVGISRIYLGAHFPSDVVGGAVIGVVGLALAIAQIQ